MSYLILKPSLKPCLTLGLSLRPCLIAEHSLRLGPIMKSGLKPFLNRESSQWHNLVKEYSLSRQEQ